GLPAPRCEPDTALTSTSPSSSSTSRWRLTAAAVSFSFFPIAAALTGPCDRTACMTFSRVVLADAVPGVDFSEGVSANLVIMVCSNYRQLRLFGHPNKYVAAHEEPLFCLGHSQK